MKNRFITLICIVLTVSAFPQAPRSLLWKVSGNGLEKPSYLFGTFHLLGCSFADSLAAVMNAFHEADAVVGELVIDSSIQAPMMAATQLPGSTLKEILPDTLYQKADAWFRQEAGFPLSQLETFNPQTVISLAMLITQERYLPVAPGELFLDVCFQERGRASGKEIHGLESIQDQVHALFGSTSLERQIEIMTETFYDTTTAKEQLFAIYKAYRDADFGWMQKMMYSSMYRQEEIAILLEERDKAWVAKLPGMMKGRSLFIAVGALHLPGLTDQLRKIGFDVTPVPLYRQ